MGFSFCCLSYVSTDATFRRDCLHVTRNEDNAYMKFDNRKVLLLVCLELGYGVGREMMVTFIPYTELLCFQYSISICSPVLEGEGSLEQDGLS